jgi:hypothetical protein
MVLFVLRIGSRLVHYLVHPLLVRYCCCVLLFIINLCQTLSLHTFNNPQTGCPHLTNVPRWTVIHTNERAINANTDDRLQFVDGLAVAEAIQNDNGAEFDLLKSVHVEFVGTQMSGDTCRETCAMHRVIEVDVDDNPIKVGIGVFTFYLKHTQTIADCVQLCTTW